MLFEVGTELPGDRARYQFDRADSGQMVMESLNGLADHRSDPACVIVVMEYFQLNPIIHRDLS